MSCGGAFFPLFSPARTHARVECSAPFCFRTAWTRRGSFAFARSLLARQGLGRTPRRHDTLRTFQINNMNSNNNSTGHLSRAGTHCAHRLGRARAPPREHHREGAHRVPQAPVDEAPLSGPAPKKAAANSNLALRVRAVLSQRALVQWERCISNFHTRGDFAS